MDIEIIFENDELLVINKPAGLIVHSDGRTEEPTLADWVLTTRPFMQDVGEPWKSPQGEVIPRPGIVHRLDRMTSGVMVLAKTQAVHAFLKQQFQSRLVQKTYIAYVYGHPKEDSGIIELEIRRTKTIPPRWTAEPGGSKKRAAITHWHVVARGVDSTTGEKISYMQFFPKTGRTHQIRVHAKSFHYPIVCDPLYAPHMPATLQFKRIALHAHELTLDIPNAKRTTFTAPPPEDFQNASKIFSQEPPH